MKELTTPQGPPYKGKNGAFLTKTLFYESMRIYVDPPYNPVFCLYGERPGLISCQKTFIEERDPTGYKWAIKYLGEYEHFKRLMKIKYFQEAYDTWIEELNELIRSEAIQRVQEILLTGQPAQQLQAAKWLASKEWEEVAKTRRGRPSKTEVEGELKRQVQLSKQEQEDLERIGLRVINGGKTKNG